MILMKEFKEDLALKKSIVVGNEELGENKVKNFRSYLSGRI